MATNPNPYAAPAARVEDAQSTLADTGSASSFVPEGIKVPPNRGWRWLKSGTAPVRAQPLTWLGLSIVFLLITVFLALIPVLGALILVVIIPVFLAGFLIGIRVVETGEPIRFKHLFAGLSAHPGRLIALGAIQMIGMVLMLLVISATGGAELDRLMFELRSGTLSRAVPSRILLAAAIYLALLTPYLMASWFAPALIALDHQSVGRSLRASFIACAKNWVPFTVYSALGFVIVGLGFGILIALSALLYSAFGAIGLGAFVIVYLLAILMLIPIVLVTLYASYRDVFHPHSATARSP